MRIEIYRLTYQVSSSTYTLYALRGSVYGFTKRVFLHRAVSITNALWAETAFD
jgi:hypothetical protein